MLQLVSAITWWNRSAAGNHWKYKTIGFTETTIDGVSDFNYAWRWESAEPYQIIYHGDGLVDN